MGLDPNLLLVKYDFHSHEKMLEMPCKVVQGVSRAVFDELELNKIEHPFLLLSESTTV